MDEGYGIYSVAMFHIWKSPQFLLRRFFIV